MLLLKGVAPYRNSELEMWAHQMGDKAGMLVREEFRLSTRSKVTRKN